MKRQFSGMLLLMVVSGYANAQSDVYLCIGANGIKEYKNTDITKGCKKVDLPGITTVSAPPRRAMAPSGFPTIDSTIQKERDHDRKQILLDEMKTEEENLASLKKEYKNGEPDRNGDERNYAKYLDRVASLKQDIDRSEQNVEALQREIDNLK